MSKYEARINEETLYAVIVRIDNGGQESVIHGYKGRHFATLAAAQKSTSKHIAGM